MRFERFGNAGPPAGRCPYVNGLANGIKTAALLGLLSAAFILIGGAIGGTRGLTIGLILAVVMNGISYFYSDRIALASMHARPVSEAEQPAMYAIVRELATAAHQPMPRLYVSPTMQPNAFATGRNPRHAAVCATEGILQILDRREMRAVLGHELSHVYNRDILISSVAATLAAGITYYRPVRAVLRRRQRRPRPQPVRRADHADPGPDRRRAHPDGDQPVPGVPGRRVRRRADRRPAGAGERAAEAAGRHPGRCRCRSSRPREHEPPDDRQPVPGSGPGAACSPPTRRWTSGSPGWSRWPKSDPRFWK